MKLRRLLLLSVALPLVACGQGAAAPVATAPAAAAAKAAPAASGDPLVELAARLPGTKAEELRATPVPGIFELTQAGQVSYVTEDGKYIFSGDLYQITPGKEFPNLTELRRRELRVATLARVPESQMLSFGSAKAAHTITVFTDIDCPWCQRLHSQIAQYNKLGIRVRYMFFPRTGPDTPSWAKAESVWCSKDRAAMFTRAKQGEDVPGKVCTGSPVARGWQLGQELGVEGTPGIVLETGELVPGYLPPDRLLAHINASIAESRAAQK